MRAGFWERTHLLRLCGGLLVPGSPRKDGCAPTRPGSASVARSQHYQYTTRSKVQGPRSVEGPRSKVQGPRSGISTPVELAIDVSSTLDPGPGSAGLGPWTWDLGPSLVLQAAEFDLEPFR